MALCNVCKCGYSRRTHLIGLLSASITYAALIAALLITSDRNQWIICSWVAVVLVCVVFWLLRARPKCFPVFHFVTLCIEFVYNCVSFAYLIYWSTIYALRLRDDFDKWLLVVTAAVALLAFQYALLVYVTLAMPYMLLRGTVAQRAALAKEVPTPRGIHVPGVSA